MCKLDPVLLIKTGFVTDQYPAVPVSKKIKPFQKKSCGPTPNHTMKTKPQYPSRM